MDDATHADATAHSRKRPPIRHVHHANHRDDDDDDDLRRAARVRANLGTRDDDTHTHPGWRVYRTDRLPRARETMRGTRARTRTRTRMI